MKCVDCPYCWKGENDRYPCCQYKKLGDFDLAPCEQDDIAQYDDEPEQYSEDEIAIMSGYIPYEDGGY